MTIRIRERRWSTPRTFPWFAWAAFLGLTVLLGYALLLIGVTVIPHIPALSQ